MMKTFEYRLYPTRVQRDQLLSCLQESRHLYNEMLEMVKAGYDETGKFLSRYDLTYRFKGRGGEHVPASTVQTLADRLDKALKRFFHRKELGCKTGFPRFKPANRWHSIQLRQYGSGRDVLLDPDTRRLRVPKKLGSRLKIKQHRPLEGTPKTAHLVYRADGHWYVLIVCDLGDAPDKRKGDAVGLDVGLKVFVADSDGNTVENPRCFKNSQKKLRRAQRKTARRKKGSHRKKKAARQTAKQHLKIARQRKDHAHKTARAYVDAYAFIAVEDLRIENMLKNHHLAKAIADAGWSAFINILTLKAEEAGARVIEVTAHFTSQRCFDCGEIVQKSLSVRTHVCGSCGYTDDRDVNAARNILARAEPSCPNVDVSLHGTRSRLL
ncbi:MAG: IS200/IS605 family element transposase accessory protein TnpB [Rubrobacter sp.]|nr:IS200/IS605 family element transposase accessory protein TnpB [Rubrobacter sp.]